MFALTSNLNFFLYSKPTDMRKSFDGLCGIVVGQLKRDPLCGDVFVFINKSRNKMKLLHWEEGGFVLYYKRLESGTLDIPSCGGTTAAKLKWRDLLLMIDGIKLEKFTQRKRFSKVQG